MLWAVRCWVVLAALAAAVAALAAFQIGRPDEVGWVRAGEVEELRAAGVIYLADHLVFVVADQERILALSAISPHRPELGERVLFCRSSGWFEAPHGEKFDRWGAYADGPAPRGLDRVQLRIRDGAVEVLADGFVTGPLRGSLRVESPIGPFCSDSEELREGAAGFALEPR